MEKTDWNGLSGEHLGRPQLQALVDGRAGEWVRQLAAEHISQCDECLEEYLALLEEEPLLEPATPAMAAVEAQREKRRRRRGKAGRFVIIFTAACLAMAMWGFGTFLAREQAKAPDLPRQGLAQKLDEAAHDVSDAFNGFFAGAQRPSPGGDADGHG